MKTCGCGHVHCCHDGEVKKQIFHDTTDLGLKYSFERSTCAECGHFLGDRVLEG